MCSRGFNTLVLRYSCFVHVHCICIHIVMDDVGTDKQMPVSPESKAYYLNDPKKALKSFFDREGNKNISCTCEIL